MRIAILGCGPSGLMAAHAARLNGCQFSIFSKKRKSYLFGSQYLHEPIPGISDEEAFAEVLYQTNGSPVEYRRKVHGDAWDGVVSPEDFEEHHLAWNIRDAYEKLWQMYGQCVDDFDIRPMAGLTVFEHTSMELNLSEFDLIVSTVPRMLWQTPGDQFISSKGWALGDAPEHGVFVPYRTPRDNMIICDGTKDQAYSRLSRVFGYTTVEWPHHVKPPLPGVSEVVKPLRFIAGPSENPTQDWLHVGRYGKWQKGILVTDAFTDVLKATQ